LDCLLEGLCASLVYTGNEKRGSQVIFVGKAKGIGKPEVITRDKQSPTRSSLNMHVTVLPRDDFHQESKIKQTGYALS
jgi:hypothetical protein